MQGEQSLKPAAAPLPHRVLCQASLPGYPPPYSGSPWRQLTKEIPHTGPLLYASGGPDSKLYLCVWTPKMWLEAMLIVVGEMEVMLVTVMTVMVLMVAVDNGDTGVWVEITEMTAGSSHRS